MFCCSPNSISKEDRFLNKAALCFRWGQDYSSVIDTLVLNVYMGLHRRVVFCLHRALMRLWDDKPPEARDTSIRTVRSSPPFPPDSRTHQMTIFNAVWIFGTPDCQKQQNAGNFAIWTKRRFVCIYHRVRQGVNVPYLIHCNLHSSNSNPYPLKPKLHPSSR